MKSKDRQIGMGQPISRRDILHGVGAVAAASFVPGQAFADAMLASEEAAALGIYPPALTGLRGSHVGSFEVAHELAREGRRDWGAVSEPDSEPYDLVVVGAGISGLAAAHFYRKKNPDARVLILDNHDDFGGHAKRNEFSVGGRTVLGYGGSQTLESPSSYSAVAKGLLADMGVDIQRLGKAYDQKFYRQNGLREGIHFDRDHWGSDRVVPYNFGALGSYLPLASSSLSAEEAVQKMPLSDAARTQFLRLLNRKIENVEEMSPDDMEEYLYTLSYKEFLERHYAITEPDVFKLLQDLTADSSVGIESASAGSAVYYGGLPGLPWSDGSFDDEDPYIHHFPDGNASVARLLVRSMIPAVAPGSTMEDVVTARFDYSKLDVADTAVRLRLNSTVTLAEHDGDVGSAKSVSISYVRDGKAYRVKAQQAVLACYNGIIPALCPELPERQREALKKQVKAPILYTTVALNNWRAWKNIGIGAVVSPTDYHINAMLDFPVSIGDYSYPNDPDQPITVHMERFPHRSNAGLSTREQKRFGRHELYATSFEEIERNVRNQLASILGPGGFDPAKDIAGITVNRWAHGYADYYNYLEDPYYGNRNDERYPHVIGRKPFGRITIANSDSAARAMLESAVDQAHRAVSELKY